MNVLTTRTWRKSRIASGCIGRDSVTSSAIAAIYATTDPGPERQAALAALTAKPEPIAADGSHLSALAPVSRYREHWDRATQQRR